MNSMEEQVLNRCLSQIDVLLIKRIDLYEINVKHIYGGMTVRNLKKRREEHIQDKDHGCDDYWIIEPVAFYEITGELTPKEYIVLNKKIEQYLIDRLAKIYKNKCVNARDAYGNILQTGGFGVQPESLQIGRTVQFYIFYDL